MRLSSIVQKWPIQIINCSLVDVKKHHPNVTAVVNAASGYMRGGGSLDGAIHSAAGPQLLSDLKQLVPHQAQPAQVIITKGYKTGFAHILHVAGPVYVSHKRDECQRLLKATYKNVIHEADKLKTVTALGLPSISTGSNDYPLDDAASAAIKTVARELSQTQNLKTIIFAMYTKYEFDVFTKAYEQWKQKHNKVL